MAPGLDTILTQITTTNNAGALNHTLRTTLPKETRDTILAGMLGSGQDPLSVLDMRENTVGVLWILAARVSTTTNAPPHWEQLLEFCATFVPEHARLAPDRVSALARGIVACANASANPKAAVQPLALLVRRYPPSPSHLTALHAIFALHCCQIHAFSALLPVLATPITDIDLTLSPDLTYNDSLLYHYLGGIAHAALKHWADAEDFLEIALSTPGSIPAALQLEALKKLRLIQLIARGKVSSFCLSFIDATLTPAPQISPLPRYTHSHLNRLFKPTPYNAFVAAYPHNPDLLHDIARRDATTFASEMNTGLITQALLRAPRWELKKLTSTYVTLALSDIAKAIKLPDEDAVSALLLDMIESSDISAQISSTGTVTFSDLPPTLSDPSAKITPSTFNALLTSVQSQADLLRALEKEMGVSKDYLTKAVKNRDNDSAWGSAPADEELFSLGAAGVWAEDAGFV
ncbi:hypothetical protein H0H87_001389 [Tephrocybe sp. NHM501043]|nr:hypothetical protein H0H87_001389 [Tephrocybe sp. NHM501043]